VNIVLHHSYSPAAEHGPARLALLALSFMVLEVVVEVEEHLGGVVEATVLPVEQLHLTLKLLPLEEIRATGIRLVELGLNCHILLQILEFH
jgi:hypothetical protein